MLDITTCQVERVDWESSWRKCWAFPGILKLYRNWFHWEESLFQQSVTFSFTGRSCSALRASCAFCVLYTNYNQLVIMNDESLVCFSIAFQFTFEQSSETFQFRESFGKKHEKSWLKKTGRGKGILFQTNVNINWTSLKIWTECNYL